MQLIVAADAQAAGAAAARRLAEAAQQAIGERGRAVLALSRLESDAVALREFARSDLDWTRVHIFQVDERAVPATDARRNALHLHAALVAAGRLPPANWHPMPVEEPDQGRAASNYEALLRELGGAPARLDAIHLGLGTDGHTASLLPGSAALKEREHAVSWARSADGQLRMTLTYPPLDRARSIVWLVVGSAKAPMLSQLLRGQGHEPALQVAREHAVVIADVAAAAEAEQ